MELGPYDKEDTIGDTVPIIEEYRSERAFRDLANALQTRLSKGPFSIDPDKPDGVWENEESILIKVCNPRSLNFYLLMCTHKDCLSLLLY